MSNSTPIPCPACGHAYTLDLSRYGGKKIRCGQCQGIIMVPAAAPANGEPEIIDDADPPANSPAKGTLHRHRMASQRGAVNIALLQRNEGSREEIRAAFLELHGDEADRIPDSIVAVVLDRRAAEADLEAQKFDERAKTLQTFVDTWSVAENDISVGKQICARTFSTSHWDKLYEQALLLTGGPVPCENYIAAESSSTGPVLGGDLFGSLVSNVMKALDTTRHVHEQLRRLPTFRAAIAVIANMKAMVQDQIADANKQYDDILGGHEKACRQELKQAEDSLRNGASDQAASILEELIKQAPLPLLGRTIATLSKCSYRAGNLSDAARHMQEAMCFGASAPVDMDEGFNDLWAKASAGLPKT